jgi:tetratricopeptide (TPR) repeat protein
VRSSKPRWALRRTRLSRSASSCWPTSATSRPKRTISRPQSRPASAASRSPRRATRRSRRRWSSWRSLAYDRAGPHERAAVLAEDARLAFDELGDRWGAGSSALTGALGALARGDIATAAALTAEAVRLHDDYDIGAVPAALLEAALAERRGDTEAAAAAYRRALERSERAGFADHAAFALSGIGSNALADGDLREAEELQRQALVTAEAAHATWAAAHARVQLARTAAAAGDAATAERLYRQVLEWSRTQRPHQAREGLFLALAGSPATAAELGLVELGATALT